MRQGCRRFIHYSQKYRKAKNFSAVRWTWVFRPAPISFLILRTLYIMSRFLSMKYKHISRKDKWRLILFAYGDPRSFFAQIKAFALSGSEGRLPYALLLQKNECQHLNLQTGTPKFNRPLINRSDIHGQIPRRPGTGSARCGKPVLAGGIHLLYPCY